MPRSLSPSNISVANPRKQQRPLCARRVAGFSKTASRTNGARQGATKAIQKGHGDVGERAKNAVVNPDGVWLVVGLGNPGPAYAGTRHNIGFQVLDCLAKEEGVGPISSSKCKALVTPLITICGRRCVLAKPQTYMNLSGASVAELRKFYKVELACVLVVHDDLDLGVGVQRIRQQGTHGGHNGLRDIINKCGGERTFPRIKIGIGHPQGRKPVEAYVLEKFTKDERVEMDIATRRASEAIRAILRDGTAKAMNAFNGS